MKNILNFIVRKMDSNLPCKCKDKCECDEAHWCLDDSSLTNEKTSSKPNLQSDNRESIQSDKLAAAASDKPKTLSVSLIPCIPCNAKIGKSEKETERGREKSTDLSQDCKSRSLTKVVKKSVSITGVPVTESEYSKDEWDRFGLFIATECKQMEKENAKKFKKKCLELIVEYQPPPQT